MSRPKKWRRVCTLPENERFGPLNNAREDNFVIMSIDEYEAIRLIDNESMKQEECAAKMNVARTTVTGIYDSARKKIADAIVNGKTLIIKGGDYQLCDGNSERCGRGCRRHRCL